MRRGLRFWLGGCALAVLGTLSLAMAAAGPEVVPAFGGGDDPGWLLGPFGDGLGIEGGDYVELERAALLAYAVVVACASALPRRLLAGAIIGLVTAFTMAPPLLSLDLFSYVSYARLEGLNGLNPYEFGPGAIPGDEAAGYVEAHLGAPSVYGPLFTLLSLPLAHVGVAVAVWALKLLAGASVLAIAWLLARLAGGRGIDPRPAAALVALNPLVLVHVVGGGHNDALMAALMTAALAAILGGRPAAGGAGIAGAAAIKASALLLAPFAILGSERRGRLALGFAGGAVVVAGAGLLAFGSGVGEALEIATANQGRPSRLSLPSELSRGLGIEIGVVRAAALALYALVAAGLLAWVARGADWVRAAGWAALGLLAASSYLTPWYVIWVLPLAAVSRDRALVAASVLFSAFLLREQVPGLGG